MSISEKANYFIELLGKRLSGKGLVCPDCGSSDFRLADRKFLVAELRRCDACKLLYRAPTDTLAENEGFYQDDYSEGFTTDTPDDAELARLKETVFADSGKSFAYYIGLLEALGVAPGARLFDYGCSWGYGDWQFARHGYDVTACEISRPRAEFARRKLGVNCLPRLPDANNLGELAHSFDVFFSSHVFEHVPSPREVIKLARALLKPDGLFVVFTPNGSAAFKASSPAEWHSMWGKVHPNVIDDVYYRAALPDARLHLDSSPVDPGRLTAWAAGREPGDAPLTGGELLCVARF